MPKSSARRQPPALTRKQISRREREQRNQKYLIIGTAAVLGLVLLIIVGGLIEQYVLRPARPVATVADVPLRLDAYQKLYKYQRWVYDNQLTNLQESRSQVATSEDQAFLTQYYDQQIQQIQNAMMSLATDVLNEVIDDEIAKQECSKLAITIAPDDVQLKLEQYFGYDRNPPTPEPVTATLPITVTPTPTTAPMTREEFVQRSDSYLKAMRAATGFGEEDFRRLVQASLCRTKLREVIISQVATTTEQIHVRMMTFTDTAQADLTYGRVTGGEDFAAIANATSPITDEQKGGDIGWIKRDQMPPEIETALFGLEAGQVSQVISYSGSLYLFKVDERDLNRPIDSYDLEEIQNKAVEDWYTTRRNSAAVKRMWDSSMVPQASTQTSAY